MRVFDGRINEDVCTRNGESLMGLKLLKDNLTISRRKIHRTNAEVGPAKPEGV